MFSFLYMNDPEDMIEWDISNLSTQFNLRSMDNVERLHEADDGMAMFLVYFSEPRLDKVEMGPFNGGVWRVRVTFSKTSYPRQYPQFQFIDSIYHPNINFLTGILPRDVYEHKWSPTHFDVSHFFLRILPPLLLNPNEEVRFENEEAGHLWKTDKFTYERRVKEFLPIPSSPVMAASGPTTKKKSRNV